MLLTDSNIVTLDDMAAFDPEVRDVIAAEGFDAVPLIYQAWGRSAARIQRNTRPRYEDFADPVMAAHIGISGGPLQLSRVVVSPDYSGYRSPIEQWMTWEALATVYRAAANRRTSDRYEAKLDRAEQEAERIWRDVFASGLPTVSNPLPCPGAIHEWGAGVFGDANVSTTSGGTGVDDLEYSVAITWLDAEGVESGPSTRVTRFVAAGQQVEVSIAGLTPPAPRPNYRLRLATSWLVYCGVEQLTLQGAESIGVSSITFDPGSGGAPLGTGQAPDGIFRTARLVGRA